MFIESVFAKHLNDEEKGIQEGLISGKKIQQN